MTGRLLAVGAVLAAISFVSGCSSDTEATTVTVTATQVRTETITENRTVSAAVARPRRGELSFRGNGDRNLPPIRVRRGGARARWTNDGPVFSLIGRKGIIVDSVASSGATYLPPGRHSLQVIAAGTWTITIPRARGAT